MRVNVIRPYADNAEYYGLLLNKYDLCIHYEKGGRRTIITIDSLEELVKFQADLAEVNEPLDSRLVIYPCEENYADYEFIIYDYYLE